IKTNTWTDNTKAKKVSEAETTFADGHPSFSKSTNYLSNGTDVENYTETDFAAAAFDSDGNLVSGKIKTNTWTDNTKAKKVSEAETTFADGHPSFSKSTNYLSNGTDVENYTETDFAAAAFDSDGNLASGKIKTNTWTDN